jgi:hypothetical protein
MAFVSQVQGQAQTADKSIFYAVTQQPVTAHTYI